FFDRSFGPILPLYVEQVGVPHSQVTLVAGILFSVMACAGALGHHFCGRLLTRFAARTVIAGGGAIAAFGCAGLGASGSLAIMIAASTRRRSFAPAGSWRSRPTRCTGWPWIPSGPTPSRVSST